MLPLAHLGIGCQALRWRKWHSLKPVFLGTLLPDLIDKPLYYIPVLLTGHHGAELGLFSGTRTVGHSLLFFFLLGLVALATEREWWLALFLGVATHLLLDNFAEPFAPLTEYSSRIALLFPLYGVRFPIAQHRTLGEHFMLHLHPLELVAEAVGAGLLWRMFRESGLRFRRAREPAA
ncbi:MAG: metal-dependent hydrolase [Bdellovibrionota bacterium]